MGFSNCLKKQEASFCCDYSLIFWNFLLMWISTIFFTTQSSNHTIVTRRLFQIFIWSYWRSTSCFCRDLGSLFGLQRREIAYWVACLFEYPLEGGHVGDARQTFFIFPHNICWRKGETMDRWVVRNLQCKIGFRSLVNPIVWAQFSQPFLGIIWLGSWVNQLLSPSFRNQE